MTAASRLAALALVLPLTAQAQARRVAVSGGLAIAEHRVDDRTVAGGVEISRGTLFDVGMHVSLGPRGAIALTGRTGMLHPGPGATLPRELAELGVDGTVMVRPWLDVVGGLRVRSYTTMVARQRWTMPYLGAALRLPFAIEGLRGVLDATVHPFASVNGLVDPEVAATTGAGVAYARGRLDAQLRYTVERYDFARGTSDERLEQLSVLTLELRVRALGRKG